MTEIKSRHTNDGWLSLTVIAIILIIDQIIKVEVKTTMSLGEAIHVTDWFYIEFIENNGMAYGMTLFNKLVLSIFRIIAVSAIGMFIYRLVRQKHSTGYLVCLSMVLAGAAGNIIDCMFYGLIFEPSTTYTVSSIVPFGEGYSTFLHGKVVDMFYFPIIQTTWPLWMPFCGGEEFVFFSPVFNFADACISVGVVLLLLFYRGELEKIGSVWHNRDENKTGEAVGNAK